MSSNPTQELTQTPTKQFPEEIKVSTRLIRTGSIFEDDDYEEYDIESNLQPPPNNTQTQDPQPPSTPTNICLKWLNYCKTACVCYFHPLLHQNICYTANCFLYQWLNLISTIVLFWFQSFTGPVWFILIFAACIGIPLLWICLEIALLLARLDLALAYHLMGDAEIEERRHLIKMSVYSDGIPLCFCFAPNHPRHNNISDIIDDDGNGICTTFKNIWRRLKFLLFSKNMNYILLYHTIVKPLVTVLTFWIPLLIMAVMVYVFLMWDYVTRGILVFEKLLLLLLIPVLLRMSNWAAEVNKKGVFYVYTYIYSGEEVMLNDESSLLEYNYLQKQESDVDDEAIYEYNRRNRYIFSPSAVFSCQQDTVYRL